VCNQPVTLVGVLNACASVLAIEEGRSGHEQIIENRWDLDVFVGNSLVNMYAKFGNMEDANRVFNKMLSHDVVTWNVMIFGYVKCGQSQKALELCQEMQHDALWPSPVTFVGLLNSCASLIALEQGRRIHKQIIGCVYESNVFVGSSLVDMYAKCGSMEDACRVFNKMPSRDVVAWNAMIFGYMKFGQGQKALELFQQMQQEHLLRTPVTWNVMIFGHVKCGQGQNALELFQQMQHEGVQPTAVTFVAVLNSCASLVALEQGRCAHEQIIESGYESDVCVGNSFVDMYAKCGSMEDACRVFNKLPSHDLVSWNTLLGGYAMHGHQKKALKNFKWMCEEGYNQMITFISLLSACSHAGLVVEGLCCYASMSTIHKISAKLEHYICLVDLLGHAGHLQEAENMIKAMPYNPNVAVWMALLGACRIHGDVEMAERVVKQVLELEPENAAGYVLLS